MDLVVVLLVIALLADPAASLAILLGHEIVAYQRVATAADRLAYSA